ncbi:hypothetical protein ACFOY2_40295 [Nonomuraea purpurea]|uniref:Secreted protein n=1 Tax=Nonomuraea purpurea TaxID=1849276 RepID=A0ABV8GKV4_9ACTN
MRVRGVTMAGLLTALSLTGPHAQAAEARRLYDFAAQGVIIWSEPWAGSTRAGLGYPGQGFVSDYSEEHDLYRCGDFDATLWYHGHNATTAVVGWVPGCNLADPD